MRRNIKSAAFASCQADKKVDSGARREVRPTGELPHEVAWEREKGRPALRIRAAFSKSSKFLNPALTTACSLGLTENCHFHFLERSTKCRIVSSEGKQSLIILDKGRWQKRDLEDYRLHTWPSPLAWCWHWLLLKMNAKMPIACPFCGNPSLLPYFWVYYHSLSSLIQCNPPGYIAHFKERDCSKALEEEFMEHVLKEHKVLLNNIFETIKLMINDGNTSPLSAPIWIKLSSHCHCSGCHRLILPLRLPNHPNSQFQVTLNSSLLLAVALLTDQEKTQLVIIVKPRQVKYCGEKIKWFGNIYSLKS